MHLFFPLRSKWRAMAVAMLAALMLTVLTAGSVLAQGHVANDGQTLEMQSPEVQAIYASVWGDNAAMQWAADHNAAIGQVAPQAQHPRYDEVFHVAYMRSMDMELAGRITADVIARGTIDQFMAGMDMGVVYGYVAPAPPPGKAPSTSTSTSSGSSTPTSASTSTVSGWGVRSPTYYYEVGQSVSLTLPTAPGAVSYTLIPTAAVPDGFGLDISSDMRNLSGRLTAPTTEGVEYTYTALEADGTTVEDHLDMDYVLTLTIHVRNADLQPFFTTSVKSETITEGDDLDEAALARLVLPMASGGNEPVNYAVTGVPTGFVAPPEGTTPGEITGGMNAKVGTYLITLTATDVDKDKASLSFTITVEKNVKPSVGNISDMSFTVGDEVEVLLPAGSGGNGELMYSTSALPGGLELSTKRYLHGELAEDATVGQTIVTYTVTDRDGDTAVDSFVITINAAE